MEIQILKQTIAIWNNVMKRNSDKILQSPSETCETIIIGCELNIQGKHKMQNVHIKQPLDN